MNVGVIALIVLFQDEIRRFLLTLGSHRHVSALARLFSGSKKESLKHDDIMPTFINVLKIEPNSFISSTCVTTSQIRIKTKIPVNTLMEPEAVRITEKLKIESGYDK